MGEEEKKEEGKKEEEGKKVEGDEKKEEETVEIVLKVDMHCEACARKVARALKGFQGVEDVTADYKASKVIVKGKTADPIKVCQRIQKKSGRKVELISPLPKPQPDDNKEENKETPPPPPQDNNKEQPPAVIIVALSIQMHCEACAQVLQKRIKKIKGVESVTADVGNNKVVVKGIVDPEKLVADVYKRTRKQASVVKEGGGEEKKKEEEEEEKKQEEKKDEEKVEEKKEGEGEGEDGGKEGGEDKKTSDIKKNEYWPSKYYYTEYSNYPPQFFSDENPNACSLM